MQPSTVLRRNLAELVAGEGPWLSAYVNLADPRISFSDPDGDRPIEMVAMAERLVAAPASEDAMSRAVILRADGRHVSVDLPDPFRADHAQFGPLPLLSPLLEAEQQHIAHAVITITEEQTDVVTFGAAADPLADPTMTTLAGLVPHGAEAVGNAIVEHLPFAGVRFVVIAAFDDRTAQLVGALLEQASDVKVEVARVPSGADPADFLTELTVALVADTAARDTVDALKRFQHARRKGRVVEGAAATMAALSRSVVGELLIEDDVLHQPFAWMAGSMELAGRAVDGAIVDALRRGCLIRVLPDVAEGSGPVEGIGGLLLDAAAVPHARRGALLAG